MTKKHIRFDWAAKKMLRDKKNFDILEGFLSELLKEDIKIEGLLESESNQEEEDDKFNRVDLYAENSKGEHIIIEIQNTRELDYLMRMLFGTSKAITEYLETGKPYADIKKVIAVSIIYFGLGKGDDYIYVGQTKFLGLHSKKELELSKTQQELLKKPTIQQAFPEYYLIQTTRFKDIINEPLDEWIYFFKNNEVLDGFKAKGMEAVREKLAVHNLPDLDRKKYNRFLDNLHSEASIAQTIIIEQEERLKEQEVKFQEKFQEQEGGFQEKLQKQEGEFQEKLQEKEGEFQEKVKEAKEEERKKMVLGMIKMNLPNEQIEILTGFSEKEIDEMRKVDI
jgi:predicted transposase/invertase (TIGR01784 family)